MSEGERTLPTAEEIAELYSEYDLDQLVSLAGDVDDHDALTLLRAARRIKGRERLAAALNLPVIREERARQYEYKLAWDVETHNQRALMRQAAAAQPAGVFLGDPGAAQPFVPSAQSAAPSE